MKLETRATPVSYKSGRTLSGVAIRYDTPSPINGGEFHESFKPGSINTKRNVMALFNHNDDALLGTSGSGTLKLYDDGKELRYEIELPHTTVGNDTLELAKRGDLTGASIGFVPQKDNVEIIDGQIFRDISAADLHEISLVTKPAHETTLEV